MKTLGRLADKILSAVVPPTTAAAATAQGCTNYFECRFCPLPNPPRPSLKSCWYQICDGQYVNGACGRCGAC